MARSILAGCAALVLGACCAFAADDLYAPRVHSGGGPMVENLPKGLVLDSLWHRTSVASGVCRVLNRKDRWVAECGWVDSESPPAGIYTLEEIARMAEQGAFSESSLMTAARYRWLVKARSLEAARAAALEKRPRRAPAAVRRLLLAQVRQAVSPDSASAR